MEHCIGHATHFISNPQHEKGTRLIKKRDVQSGHAGYSRDMEGMVELTSPGHLPPTKLYRLIDQLPETPWKHLVKVIGCPMGPRGGKGSR